MYLNLKYYFLLIWVFSLGNCQEIPRNSANPLFCNSCTNCLRPRPVVEHMERRDNSFQSYCYTRQYLDRGLLTIQRGSIRPPPSEFKANLQTECPFKSFSNMATKDQWCFCKGHDCNDVVMEYDGKVKDKPYQY